MLGKRQGPGAAAEQRDEVLKDPVGLVDVAGSELELDRGRQRELEVLHQLVSAECGVGRDRDHRRRASHIADLAVRLSLLRALHITTRFTASSTELWLITSEMARIASELGRVSRSRCR